MAFDLSSIKSGKDALQPRIVVYSEHGLGKSTFASQAPAPIFIQTEEGLSGISTQYFPLATSYEDVMSALTTLYSEPHDYKTVVIDSLDWMEQLVWKYVAKKHNHQNIEDFGYGKGYTVAADSLREVLEALDGLRKERGMIVVCTAHHMIKRFDDPAHEPYDRYQLKLHKTSSALIQEWADVVGFASQQLIVKQEDAGFNKKVKRGIETGGHVLHLKRTPAWDAKNRYGLPDVVPLIWDEFWGHFQERANQ